MADIRDDYEDDYPGDVDDISDEERDALYKREATLREVRHVTSHLADEPLFKTLFLKSIDPDDVVLMDFAQYTVGPLSDMFGAATAKGGAFFRRKEQEGAPNTQRYKYDQMMRAHLINGMLPALHVARLLATWGTHPLRQWNQTAERLFIAGYMLHDYTKIQAVKQTLHEAGFTEMEAPSEAQIPTLERIFREWCQKLGLVLFLQPVGGVEDLLQDVIYVALNTQVRNNTAHAPTLLPNISTDDDIFERAADISHLADLLAYVARTPRELVSHATIKESLTALSIRLDATGKRMRAARLTYHHVAENRGVLLNFIHNAALEAITTGEAEGKRVPLLYAPSGVVYLERYDAPPMPDPATLTDQIVSYIRNRAGKRLIDTGKGAKRGNVSVQVDDSYNDFFDLREFIRGSVRLVEKLVKNNKSPERLAAIRDENWPGGDNIPAPLTDPRDVRLDRLAEWIKLVETVLENRYHTEGFTDWIFGQLGIEDLRREFEALRSYPRAKSADGGLKRWWFWAAAHALARQPGIRDDQVLEWLDQLAANLAAMLPDDLPLSAQVNQDTWGDLTDYIGRVLTLGGARAAETTPVQDIKRYSRAKTGRGGAACAICGSEYRTRKPAETAVAFQPGVYTARISIGGKENKRSLCTICALEQLLRQLFVDNLDSGGKAEEQRVRYLSFYPSYFFTPETLKLMRAVYGQIKAIRLSDKEMIQALRTGPLTRAEFWQRLEPFLLRAPDEEPSWRIQRYSEATEPTFLTIGLRSSKNPTDTESWVLPAFLALALSVCLDIKVVVSESGVPLMLEADELCETIWFDGAHPSIGSLVGGGRLHVDNILPALARLTAAYLIHLDTEYKPPKENWQRLGPIAHSLMESPLYVFHYLDKQERDGTPISANRIQRYVIYADTIFKNGGNDMHRAKELVRLYSQFYRVKQPFRASSYALLRPLDIVADTLLNADSRLFDEEEALIDVARGQLRDRLESSETNAIFVRGRNSEEIMRQFCAYFVHEIFFGVFKKDVAALRGKQLNLLRGACKTIYLDMQREKWEQHEQDLDTVDEESTDIGVSAE